MLDELASRVIIPGYLFLLYFAVSGHKAGFTGREVLFSIHGIIWILTTG